MKDLSESIVSSTKTGKSAVHRAAAKSINDAIDFAYENAEINKPIDMKGDELHIGDCVLYVYKTYSIKCGIITGMYGGDLRGEDDPTTVDPVYLKIDNTFDVAAYSVFALRRIEAYK